eukprot:scaffold4216_cov45-Cyclotella_meneghiniana.AAC.4
MSLKVCESTDTTRLGRNAGGLGRVSEDVVAYTTAAAGDQLMREFAAVIFGHLCQSLVAFFLVSRGLAFSFRIVCPASVTSLLSVCPASVMASHSHVLFGTKNRIT